MDAERGELDEPGLWDGQRHPLAMGFAATAAGAVCDRFVDQSPVRWFPLALCTLAAWFWTCRRKRPLEATLLLLCALFVCGGLWHQRHWRWYAADELGLRAGTEPAAIVVQVVVQTNPRFRAPPQQAWTAQDQPSWSMRIVVEKVREGRDWHHASGRGRMWVRGARPDVAAGDRLQVFGHLRSPRRARNPGEIDHRLRLRAERELLQLDVHNVECLTVLQRGAPWDPRRLLEQLRGHLSGQIERHVARPEADLAIALLLGDRDQLAPEQVESFFYTGTIHLLAISGMHLGILIYAIWLAGRLGLLSRKQTMLLAIAFVVAYTIVTRCEPPVLRAALFVLMIGGARLMMRPLLNWNVLAAAAFGVFLWNPSHLFRVGVHLSFLAVGTLTYCTRWFSFPTRDPLDRLVLQTRPWPQKAMRQLSLWALRMWLTSLVVWLVTLPLIAATFHLVSPAGIALNPVVWPPIAAALFSGFGLLLLGAVFPWLGSWLGWCCQLSLKATDWLIGVGATRLGSHFWTPSPPTWWVVGFYVLLIAWAALPRLRPSRRITLCISVLWLALGALTIIAASWRRSDDQLICTFYCVGHGTCVAIELPTGATWLYDAGHLGPPQWIARAVAHDLWSRGIYRLAGVIVSHADADHFNAVPELLDRLGPTQVFAPDHVHRDRSPLVQQLRDHLQSRGIRLRRLHCGARWQPAPGVWFEVLHPRPGAGQGSDNAQSIVLRVRYGKRSMLLPGDLEGPGIEQLLAQPSQFHDIVMAPHHGSARSDPQSFAPWCRPRWVVISSGRRASPTVVQSFRHTGAEVLQTYDSGAIRFQWNQRGDLNVRAWDDGAW